MTGVGLAALGQRLACQGSAVNTMNHYETLGIEKNATTDEVCAAYRKKAQNHHPDRDGGDKERFQMIAAAYEVLSDPDRRERYDNTGRDNKQFTKQEIENNLRSLFLSAVKSNMEIEYTDVVQEMRSHLQKNIKEINSEICSLEKSVKKFKQTDKRLHRKKEGVNLFQGVISQQIANTKIVISEHKEKAEICERMIEALDDYNYTTDERSETVWFTTGTSCST